MKRYDVKITASALEDMSSIYDYIAEELLSPQNAGEQYDRIANGILSLETFPERFPLFELEPEHSMGMRRMVIDHYLVCYIVDESEVTVISVFYGASDVHHKLNEQFFYES